MPFILRVDVDKPYGRANVLEKVASKISEEYWLPAMPVLGYLYHLKHFLDYLKEQAIPAHLYFRQCTLPPKAWLQQDILNGHKIGLHAENTRSINTLGTELKRIRAYFEPLPLTSFTKHGSGVWKSGRKHYPLYEKDKYLEWSQALAISFLFGNEELADSQSLPASNSFYPAMYWIDKLEHNISRQSVEWMLQYAGTSNVVVIIHPSNFVAQELVRDNMNKLVTWTRESGLDWITL
jgi:hypothetical protein